MNVINAARCSEVHYRQTYEIDPAAKHTVDCGVV